MNIAQMQAGPEMDARVVNEVMGGSVENPDAGSIDASIWYYNCINDSICGTPYYFGRMGKYYHTWHPFKPSTDIAAAWAVVERLSMIWNKESEANGRGEPLYLQINSPSPNLWTAQVMWAHHDGDIPYYNAFSAETAPLAICKAALMAMERENSSVRR